jgi:hypothetical protein
MPTPGHPPPGHPTHDLSAPPPAPAEPPAAAAQADAVQRAHASPLTATPGTAHHRPSIGADIIRPRAVARRAVRAAGAATQAAAQATTAATRRAVAERPRVVTPHRRLNLALELVQYPLIAAAALGAAYSATIGQWLILAYGLIAIFTRRPSRLSFGMALFLLITIPFFQALGQSGIAENAAIYTYELLVVGTIQTVLELRKTSKSANLSATSHAKM